MNAPKVKANPGQVYAAHLELRRALEAMAELGIAFPGVARDGNGAIVEGAGALTAALVNVELAVDDSLGTCFEQISALAEEIWGAWPETKEAAKWKTIEEILQRKNWPDAGWVVEQARESSPAKPAPSKRDALADRLNALYTKRSPFVHGSPEWAAVTAEIAPLEAELEALS